jgi:hypothetical protein
LEPIVWGVPTAADVTDVQPKNEGQPMTAAEQAAHDLFGVLRDLDARGVTQLWVQLPPETPEWEGVRDRLQRAAA